MSLNNTTAKPWLNLAPQKNCGLMSAGQSESQVSASPRTIAVIGDTQRTLWAERAFLLREKNDRERELLLQSLCEKDFDVLIHLGDMVENGASLRAWQEFDRRFAPILAKGAAFIALLGNHDYWGNERRRRSLIQARFPHLLQQAWRAEIYHHLGLVCIDSNRAQYSQANWAQQEHWFEEVLRDYTHDPSVAAILVFSHHPPFTNSTVLRRAQFLERVFLPAFFASHKTRAFISGHVHGYERFIVNEKTFIVSGGGGGPRLPLRRVARRQFADQYAEVAPRPFHYLLIHLEVRQLRVKVWGLQKGQTQVALVDEISAEARFG